MPNYVKNRLIVKGREEDLLDFYKKNRVSEEDIEKEPDRFGTNEYELTFEKMVPIYHLDTYHFVPYWGTNSDAIDPHIDLEKKEKDEITYTFDTAWTPPEKWCLSVSKHFPTLTLLLVCQFEDDNYDTVLHLYYYKGEEIKRDQFSCYQRFFSQKGGIHKAVEDFIFFMNQNGIQYKEEEEKMEGWFQWDIGIEMAIYPSCYCLIYFSDFEKLLKEKLDL